jgi:hypothetical protein
MAGPDPYGAFEKTLAEDKETSAKVLEQNKGLAALQAIPAVLQGGNAIRGIGAGVGALGTGFAEAAKADRAEKRYLNQMQFHLADAQRKENMGLFGEARKDVQDAETARLGAVKEARARETAVGGNYAKMTTALRQPRGAAGSGPKEPKLNERLYNANLANLRATQKPKENETPEQFNARLDAEAGALTATQVHTSDKGPNAVDLGTKQILSSLSVKSSETARKLALQEMSAKNLIGSKDQDKQYKEMYKKHYEDAMGGHAKTIGMSKDFVLGNTMMPDIPGINQTNPSEANPNATRSTAPAATGAITPEEFNKKWATLNKGQTLVGPNGVTYTKQ